MGVINYKSIIKKTNYNIFLNIISIILGVSFLNLSITNNIIVKIIFIILIIFNTVMLIINYNNLINYRKKLKEKEKEKSSFDDSYNSYFYKKYSKYNDPYSYSNNDYYKKRKTEDWYDYYNRVNEEKKQKLYEEYEKLKEEYRKKQEEYYRKNGNYYQDYQYYENKYKSNSNDNYKTTTISISEKTSNAFKLLKLNINDSEKVIKIRYRELAIKWHPDKWVNNTLENQKIAERNFKKLGAAYELIKQYKNIK